MMSRDDVELCVEAGVDAVGFIFASGPRRLPVEVAEDLTKLVPPFVTSIGVFASNDAAFIHSVLERCRLDVLQFSDGSMSEFCGSFGKPTIVVVHASASSTNGLPNSQDLRRARASALMVDSNTKNMVGGTGVRVSEKLAAQLRSRSRLPFILAGGLTPDNVAAAVRAVRPWGVDVRSGVERRGRKDRRLVERFVREARNGGGAS
jgi:phosphoribosylanthranilate isomerase